MANSLWPWACSTSARQASATGSFATAFSTVSASRVSAFQWRPEMVAPAGMAPVLDPRFGAAGGAGRGGGGGFGHQRLQGLVRRREADARARPQPRPRRGGLAPGVG